MLRGLGETGVASSSGPATTSTLTVGFVVLVFSSAPTMAVNWVTTAFVSSMAWSREVSVTVTFNMTVLLTVVAVTCLAISAGVRFRPGVRESGSVIRSLVSRAA